MAIICKPKIDWSIGCCCYWFDIWLGLVIAFNIKLRAVFFLICIIDDWGSDGVGWWGVVYWDGNCEMGFKNLDQRSVRNFLLKMKHSGLNQRNTFCLTDYWPFIEVTVWTPGWSSDEGCSAEFQIFECHSVQYDWSLHWTVLPVWLLSLFFFVISFPVWRFIISALLKALSFGDLLLQHAGSNWTDQ